MGMYDSIYFKEPAPHKLIIPNKEYQTKSLNCYLDVYQIDSSGKLLLVGSNELFEIIEKPLPKFIDDYTGYITIWGYTTKNSKDLVEISLSFQDGILLNVEML